MEILAHSRAVHVPVLNGQQDEARHLKPFSPVSLAQVNALGLSNRTDTKFVFHLDRLAGLLNALQKDYGILEIGGARSIAYETVYFDTAAFQLYLQHHAGNRNRIKIRSRRYSETDQSFLEVKFKTNTNRTLKRRVETEGLLTEIGNRDELWSGLGHRLGSVTLEPKLWNNFTRMTLVNLQQTERVTIDVDLEFQNDHATAVFPRLVIVEVKQPRRDPRSVVMQTLEDFNLHPMSFSKYCIGVATLYPQVKHNHFKPTLQYLERLDRSLTYAH